MNENLLVNSKTDILEFKRKHNLLVANGTIKANVPNIKELTNDVINNLRCGDVVLKEDSTGKHAYLVSFKSDTGLCLTYVDASCVETQSYDKSGNNWVYNSEDLTPLNKLENITDKDGNQRFIEGNISINEISGVSKSYGKWSLSGTHLMIVLALSLANETTIADNTSLCSINIPQWILDKIVPVVGGTIAFSENKAYASDYTNQIFVSRIVKPDVNVFQLRNEGAWSLTKDRTIRLQYDLLIDNE